MKENLNTTKGEIKMTELDRKLEITNFLNNNGYDTVKIHNDFDNYDFCVRVGYHDSIPAKLVEEMELAFNVRITEWDLFDDDCGMLYGYGVEVVDEDTGYTLNELNDLESNYGDLDSYLDEAEFLHRYETGEWGVS